MSPRELILSGVSLISIAAAAPAFAQDQAPIESRAPVAAEQTQIPGDIVVTARKRQESILKVPVIETAVTQAQLERSQTTDLVSLSAKVPGLVIGGATLAIGTQVSIRGVGTSSLDSGVDQSISLNIDGLQLSQGLAYTVGTFDLAQAEVLKGPQALFFGKSSPGGVISLRTADPTSQVEIITRNSYEIATHQKRTEDIISGPITDTLGVRLAALYSRDDGFFRNRSIAEDGFGGVTPTHSDFPTENIVVRLTTLWKPAPEFNARLKINYARDRTEGTAGDGQFSSCPDGLNRAPFGINFLGGAEDCRVNKTINFVWMDPASFIGVRNDGEPFSHQTQRFGTLEMNYLPAPSLTLTSVSGYYSLLQNSLINGVVSTDAGPSLSADNHFRRHDFTQELRLNSDYSGPLNFTAGGYYQDSVERNAIQLLGNTSIGLPPVLQSGTHKLDIRSYSGFGQLRYKIVPQVEFAAGVRWTHERRADTVFNNAPPPLGTGPHQVPLAVPAIKSSNWSPEATITWTPTDDLTVFGSFKQAYKSGSYTLTTIPADGGDNSFGDEKVQGGEVGLKGRALDRRLTFNLAGYYYHYTGLQVGSNKPAANGLPQIVTLNAGAATTYGIDFDVAYRPPAIDKLNLRGSVNWNHARFNKLIGPCWGGQSIAEGCDVDFNALTGAYTNQDLAGGPLVRAPAWQVAFGLDYDLPLANGRTLSFSSDNRYSSRYLTNLLGRSDMYQRAYFQTDASLALRGADDRWEFAVIGRNLTNKLVTGNCTNVDEEGGQVLGGENTGTSLPRGPAGVDELECVYNPGRQVFLRLTLRPAQLFR